MDELDNLNKSIEKEILFIEKREIGVIKNKK